MRIAVAMSGGVDSLRTAVLLKEQGHDVFAVYMRLMQPSGHATDREDAPGEHEARLRALVSRLGLTLAIADLHEAFESLVVTPFLKAYQQGLTPNPCVICNPRIKFNLLLRAARLLGAERLATGHYARIVSPDSTSSRFRLFRAIDKSKDQSYFLYALKQEQLASAILPLGEEYKRDVLQWAEEAGFARDLPEESQEICFIPSGNYQEFLRERLGLPPDGAKGPILDLQGNLLGEHKGIYAYTVGQRRGLGIASEAPYYVVAIEPASNTIRVGRAEDLARRNLVADCINWVSLPPSTSAFRCQVRIRNQHTPAQAEVVLEGTFTASVEFDEPQRAVTPGQAAVFYNGDELLGGGVIRTP